jgi:hypothetical protein
MPLSLKVPVRRGLTEKRDGHEVGPVALLRLGEDRGAHPTACPELPLEQRRVVRSTARARA